MAGTDYSYAADLLYAELRRTWPEELTKEELLAASGLSTEEAREGLALLQSQGRIDESADQLKARVEGAEEPIAALPGDSEETSPERDGPPSGPVNEVPPPSAPTTLSKGGDTYHSHFAVIVGFGQAPGTKKEAVVKTGKAMEEEIADRIHAMYEGAVTSVELQKIEISQPKVIYGGGEDGGD